MEQKFKIDGFRFHQKILESFRLMKEGTHRPPASAYAVYLSMLKQLYKENNQRGVLKEYNLAAAAKEMSIPYTTFYGGKKYLEEHHFIKEEIQNGMPVLILCDVEKYNTPEFGNDLNYFLVPLALFETNILSEFVSHSNPEAIELMLALFNQFRVGLVKNNGELHDTYQVRNMKTLKQLLNKNSKSVRSILAILEALFDIEFSGVRFRGHQLWVHQVKFMLKECCIKEVNDKFEISQLMQKYSQEITYFLDGHSIRFKPKDQSDIIFAFKQEVIDVIKYVIDDEKTFEFRDRWVKDYFMDSLSDLSDHIKKQISRFGEFKVHTSIGAYFRGVFRKRMLQSIKQIPVKYVHEAKIKEFVETGKTPALYTLLNGQ